MAIWKRTASAWSRPTPTWSRSTWSTPRFWAWSSASCGRWS